MKLKETQMQFILKELRKNGKISRNFCCKNYITRLSAYILDLTKEGWRFDKRGYLSNQFGKDYVYFVSEPKKYVKHS